MDSECATSRLRYMSTTTSSPAERTVERQIDLDAPVDDRVVAGGRGRRLAGRRGHAGPRRGPGARRAAGRGRNPPVTPRRNRRGRSTDRVPLVGRARRRVRHVPGRDHARPRRTAPPDSLVRESLPTGSAGVAGVAARVRRVLGGPAVLPGIAGGVPLGARPRVSGRASPGRAELDAVLGALADPTRRSLFRGSRPGVRRRPPTSPTASR